MIQHHVLGVVTAVLVQSIYTVRESELAHVKIPKEGERSLCKQPCVPLTFLSIVLLSLSCYC